MIYLDNAATTLRKPECVVKAVTEALTTLGNASRGAHGSSLDSNRVIYKARSRAAALFNSKRPEQTVFTGNSTEALNIAISGTIGEGDHVITTELEHNSVLRPLYRLEKERHVKLSFIRADKKGCVEYEDFERAIRPETRAIVCTHGSNLTGNLLDIKRIGETAERHGLLFILDASQTGGSIGIDMEESKVSILCFTGHKSLMGPQGTGGLLIRGDIDVRPFKTGGTGVQSYLKEQPREFPTRLEAGTLNGHGIAGLLAAMEFIDETGISKIHEHEIKLMKLFYDRVKDIPSVRVYGDFSPKERCPIVTLNIGDLDSAVVADELSFNYDIAVRAGAHCAPLMHKALGTESRGAVRFSFGYYNTVEECEIAADAVKDIAERSE